MGKYYIEESPVTITCEACGKPQPDVAWIRNGLMESSGKKAALLKFDKIKRMDTGQYTCRANNSVGVTSINTTILVHCKYILTLISISEFTLVHCKYILTLISISEFTLLTL